MDQTKQAHSPADKKAHTRPEPARGRQFERRSGSDKNDTQKKGGAGKANWGNELEDVDDIVREVHEELASK